jgi:hypothetical protein
MLVIPRYPSLLRLYAGQCVDEHYQRIRYLSNRQPQRATEVAEMSRSIATAVTQPQLPRARIIARP